MNPTAISEVKPSKQTTLRIFLVLHAMGVRAAERIERSFFF